MDGTSKNNLPKDQSTARTAEDVICEFLVGPKNRKPVVVPAKKSVMSSASKTLEDLFMKDPLCKSFTINDIDPEIFQMIVEFVTHQSPLQLENCVKIVDLLVAADLLNIDSLKTRCVGILEERVSVSDVWMVAQNLLKKDSLKPAAERCCANLLVNKTKEALEHPSFLLTNSTSINFLLEQETLRIENEACLVDYCIQWAEKQANPRDAFREVSGKCRLLSLTPNQFLAIPKEFVTVNDWRNYFKHYLNAENLKFPDHMDPVNPPRTYLHILKSKIVGNETCIHHEYSQTLIPKYLVATREDALEKNEKYYPSGLFSNSVTITPNKTIYVTQFFFSEQLKDTQLVFDQTLGGYVTRAIDNEAGYFYWVTLLKNEEVLCRTKVGLDAIPLLRLNIAEKLENGTSTTFEFRFTRVSGGSFRKISCKDVQKILETSSLDSEVFQAITVKENDEVPLMVKFFKFTIA